MFNGLAFVPSKHAVQVQILSAVPNAPRLCGRLAEYQVKLLTLAWNCGRLGRRMIVDHVSGGFDSLEFRHTYGSRLIGRT